MPAVNKESTIYMVCKAVGAIRKGVSRAAIANYLVENFGKTAGAHFVEKRIGQRSRRRSAEAGRECAAIQIGRERQGGDQSAKTKEEEGG